MLRVYLDSVIVIYLVENPPVYGVRAAEKLASWEPFELASSEFVRVETLPKPTARQQTQVVQDFDDFFESRIAVWAGITRNLFDRAIQLAADYNLKPLDSLHLAAAIQERCDRFLTNDQGLSRVREIAIEIL